MKPPDKSQMANSGRLLKQNKLLKVCISIQATKLSEITCSGDVTGTYTYMYSRISYLPQLRCIYYTKTYSRGTPDLEHVAISSQEQ